MAAQTHAAFMSLLSNLIDGHQDAGAYEDACRALLGEQLGWLPACLAALRHVVSEAGRCCLLLAMTVNDALATYVSQQLQPINMVGSMLTGTQSPDALQP